MPWSGLTCDEKDRLLATVAVADDNLHDNGGIEAPASILRTEYETLALGEWVTSRRDDVEDYEEAGHTTSEGARSAVVAYWKDGSGD
jgi:hypothetical protein